MPTGIYIRTKEHKEKTMKPSEEIEKMVNKKDFDFRNSCGANNCECYENSVKIEAICQYLDNQRSKLCQRKKKN